MKELMKLQDMIEDHQSKSKFEVQEFRSKVKVTRRSNIKIPTAMEVVSEFSDSPLL